MSLGLLERGMKRAREGSKTCGMCGTPESWPPAAGPMPKIFPFRILQGGSL